MLISIITINYNDLSGLKKTMASVLEQSYKQIEFIIIDGGSTDGSKEYIENSQKDLAYWISEPDKGIYNAMNKGINKATGDYILFLNSGDWLVGAEVINTINPTEFTEDLISCGLHVIGNDVDYVKVVPDNIGFSFMATGTLPHQSTFIKRSLFEAIGHYDENLKLVSDWKFFLLSICKFKASFRYIPTVLSSYNRYGISSLEENSYLMRLERKGVLTEEFDPFYKDFKELVKSQRKLNALRKSSWIQVLLRIRAINKF